MNDKQFFTTEEERALLLAFITWIFPSSLEKEGSMIIVDTPVGMMSWYIQPEYKMFFSHLPENMNRIVPLWTDKEKYDLLIRLAKKVGGVIVALGMLSGLDLGGKNE